jgi:parallel beta-helix repeat protein
MTRAPKTLALRAGGLAALMLIVVVAPAQAAAGTRPARQTLAKRLLGASERAARTRRGAIVARELGHGIRGIVITRDATLGSVHRRYPRSVREVKPGIWRISHSLFVARGVRLLISAPAVREVRLVSNPRHTASLIARNARLSFRGEMGRRLVVHSWDSDFRAPDSYLLDGRATIAARHRSRLDARNAVFSSLGFYKGTVSGFALWARGHEHGTGRIVDSIFTHNYNGAFTYGARAVRWIRNRFTYNAVYGLDPHTGSSEFLVQDNYAAHNRRHGIIFSHSCMRNVIRGNISELNGWHGIVLDDGKRNDSPSDYNLVHSNIVRDNGKVGIQLDGSSHNVVRANLISGGRLGVRVLGRSHDDFFSENEITGSGTAGAFVYYPARKIALDRNRIDHTYTGITLRGADTVRIADNRIGAVSSHGVKVEDRGPGLEPVSIDYNRVGGAGGSPFAIVNASRGEVLEKGNDVSWNYPTVHDLARILGRGVGPGIWAALLAAVVFGPWVVATGDRLRRRSRTAP